MENYSKNNFDSKPKFSVGSKKPFEAANKFSRESSKPKLTSDNYQMNPNKERNLSRGQKTISNNLKINENEVNEAKESLRLLKSKATAGGNNKFTGMATFTGLDSNNINTNNYGNNFGNVPSTSHNYRKVFKPTLNSNKEESKGSNYSSSTNGSHFSSNNNKFNYNSNKSSSINQTFSGKPMGSNYTNNFSQKPQPKSQVLVEEVVDDRIAVAQGNPIEPEIEETDETGELKECHVCGRKFKLESFPKHAKACKKVFGQKRKAFDMKKQRIVNEEHENILKQAEFEKKDEKLKKMKKMKKDKWKMQSEQLRSIAQANKTGGNFNQVDTAKMNQYNDYTTCGICNRSYNEDAYKRHLPHCEKRNLDNKMKGKSNATAKNDKTSKPSLNSKFSKK